MSYIVKAFWKNIFTNSTFRYIIYVFIIIETEMYITMYIGIDLGGTNIAIGIVDNDGNILKKGSRPTERTRHYSEIVKDMAELSLELTKDCGFDINDIEAIGVGSPGIIDTKDGVVLYSPNFQDFNNLSLAKELRKYIDVPITIENDANAAAYGEYIVNGNDSDSFVAITLGTGVGSGFIINKEIYRGFNGAATEFGHFTLAHNGVTCGCGKKGCWEAYASVTALIRQTKEAIAKHPESPMANDEKVSGRTAFDAAKAGDPIAQEVVNNYIEYVASGLLSIINMLQPEIIVIGGGISNEGDYLLNPIKKYLGEYLYCDELPQTEIKIATLKNDAGIIGAAFAAKLQK